MTGSAQTHAVVSSMKRLAIILAILMVAIVHSRADVSAVEFVVVGPRAVGMGGAGVAVTTDSLATYWNPAGLAMETSVDIRGQASVQVTDRLGIASTIQDVNNINRNDTSAANQTRL